MSTLRANAIQTVAGKPILNGTGSIIKTVYVRSDANTVYYAETSGSGTTVSALSISITPTSPTNRIICNWVICGEVGPSSDVVWLIHRNGSLITTAGEEGRNNRSVTDNRYYGFSPTPYDVDFNSTLFTFSMQYSQIANTTSTITYSPAIRSSWGTQCYFQLNATLGAPSPSIIPATDNYENSVSTCVLYEVVE